MPQPVHGTGIDLQSTAYEQLVITAAISCAPAPLRRLPVKPQVYHLFVRFAPFVRNPDLADCHRSTHHSAPKISEFRLP
jgi:hypothetical protein